MTESRTALARLFAACWKDDALKTRFMADPKGVLAEYGLDIPEGVVVKVVEDAEGCVRISLPTGAAKNEDLSDDELRNAAGGQMFAMPRMPRWDE